MDLVILAVKDYAYREALEQVGRFVGEDTILLPVLNGLDCARQAGEVYGPERCSTPACGWTPAWKTGRRSKPPGHGAHRGGPGRPARPRRCWPWRPLPPGGVRCRVEPDMIHCIWLRV